MEIGLFFIQPSQTVCWCIWKGLRSFEVCFDVEMWISVLLIQSPAFLDDLCDLSGAGFFGFLV